MDIVPAIDAGDGAFVRAAFRALVEFPDGQHVRGTGPTQLEAALDRVCDELAADAHVLPQSVSDALDLPPGTSYAGGVIRAREVRAELSERFATAWVRSVGGAL